MAKGKKGKGKGKKEEKLTKHEALLQHRIQIQQKTNDQITEDIVILQHAKELNQLKEETAGNQLEEEKRKLIYANRADQVLAAEKQEISNQEVQICRQKQVQLNKDLAEREDDIIREISEVETKISATLDNCEKRKKFYATEYLELSDKVALLEKHLTEMINQFNEMRTNLENQVQIARQQQDEKINQSLARQKENAIQHVIKRLPPQQAQELRENRWLLSEALVHREQIKILYNQVQILEKRNLELMGVVYSKRMARLGLLMNNASNSNSNDRNSQILLNETIKDLNKLNPISNQNPSSPLAQAAFIPDPNFSLHPSEIDLSETNFKKITDTNKHPEKVTNFPDPDVATKNYTNTTKSTKLTIKETASTDIMNKVAGLMVQGEGIVQNSLAQAMDPNSFSAAFMTETNNVNFLPNEQKIALDLQKMDDDGHEMEQVESSEDLVNWPIKMNQIKKFIE